MIKFGEGILGKDFKGIVNVIIGEGPEIDNAFTNAITRCPTPLFANLRDNLIVKPLTIVVPQNPPKSDIEVELLNGVIQYGVAKCIADLLYNGALNENLKIIANVSIPEIPYTLLNKRKLFQYYYGATKLAINRALSKYPSGEKIKKEKYRAVHPLVGFRSIKLERPPYLQVALDVPTIESMEYIINSLPKSDRIIIEAGTPLIKKYGIEVIEQIRELFDGFIVADLKTQDTGRIEVRMAFESTADGVVLSGNAPKSTILKGINECDKCGIISYLDTINVKEPLNLYNNLQLKPDVLMVHRGIDEEIQNNNINNNINNNNINNNINNTNNANNNSNNNITNITKNNFKDKKPILGIAGGVSTENIDNLKNNYDILVVGRGITKSREPGRVARYIVNKLGDDIEQYRLYLDEDEELDFL